MNDDQTHVGSNSSDDIAADKTGQSAAVFSLKNPDSWVCALIPIMEELWGDDIYKDGTSKAARDFKEVWKLFRLQHHPDKKAGCPQSEIDLAMRRMQDFNEWFCRKREKVEKRGFNLLDDIITCATSCTPDHNDGHCYFRPKSHD